MSASRCTCRPRRADLPCLKAGRRNASEKNIQQILDKYLEAVKLKISFLVLHNLVDVAVREVQREISQQNAQIHFLLLFWSFFYVFFNYGTAAGLIHLISAGFHHTLELKYAQYLNTHSNNQQHYIRSNFFFKTSHESLHVLKIRTLA